MKVFLSHARKDDVLARQLAARLTRAGFAVWLSDDEIAPGDNWAKKMGKALDESELMVILLTPTALRSDSLRRDIEFAIGAKKFKDRVFSIFVGSTRAVPKDMPWILLELPNEQVESSRDFGAVVKKIRASYTDSRLSHSHA